MVIFATDPLVCLKVQIRLNRGLLTRKQKVNRVFIKLPILLNRTCPIIYTFRRIISNPSLSKIMVKRSNKVKSGDLEQFLVLNLDDEMLRIGHF